MMASTGRTAQLRSRYRPAGNALAIAVLLTVAGCSEDGGRAATVSAPTETSGTVASVETTSAVETTALAETVSTSPTTEEEPATPSSQGSVDPSAIIITLDDMPTGWSPAPDESDDESDDEADSCLDKLFGEAELGYGDQSDVPSATAGFSQSDFGPFLSAVVATGVEGAEGIFIGLGESFAACDGTTDADGFTYSVLPVSFPALGDDTFAARIDGENDASVPVSVLIVATRVDDVVILSFNIAVMGPVDAALAEDLTRTMVERAS